MSLNSSENTVHENEQPNYDSMFDKTQEEREAYYIKEILSYSSIMIGKSYCDFLLKSNQTFKTDDKYKFVGCPHDLLQSSRDSFEIIFGGKTEKNIQDNCNSELFKLIPGSDRVTYGMIARLEGHVWSNGLIAHNQDLLIIREADNNYGQPGFLSMLLFDNNLSKEIKNRYLIPDLIQKINDNEITTKTYPESIKNEIIESYKKIYDEKYKLITDSDVSTISETTLFADANKIQPTKTEAIEAIESKDLKMQEMEKRIDMLTIVVNTLIDKINAIEEQNSDLRIEINSDE